ncbi:MAG: hypothetical protein JNM08_09430 [Rubrivivax sp.]|nr:hypothetical protein [Rubrivivax sp.]
MFAFAHLWLAMVHLDSGDAPAAAAEVRAAMPHVRRTVGVRHFALPLSHLAALQGRAKDAAQLLGVDDLARERRGEPRMPFERRREQAVQKLLSRHASEADLGAWRLIGRGLDDDATQALADAAATAS